MNRGLQILIALAVICANVNSAEVACGDEVPEKRLLTNINSLLHRDHVKIVNGIRLKRKLNGTSSDPAEGAHFCVKNYKELFNAISSKFSRIARTHVLEFDLATALNNGNLIANSRWCLRRHSVLVTLQWF